MIGPNGAGKTTVFNLLTKVYQPTRGTILLDGKECKNLNPRQSIKNNFALLTEERRATGIFGILDIRENSVISSLDRHKRAGFVLSDKSMKKDTQWSIDAMHTKTPTQETKIRSLSGGNQQKVIIGRWLLTEPDVLLLVDTRHRRRREIRDLPADPRSGEQRQDGHHGFVRNARAAGRVRPDPRHVRRTAGR